MTREEGLKEIDEAQWTKDEYDYRILEVHDEDGHPVICHLSLRPAYCDRGHIQFNVAEGRIGIDHADSFPRFFFNAGEADLHVRTFLKWRLWKKRTYAHTFGALGG